MNAKQLLEKVDKLLVSTDLTDDNILSELEDIAKEFLNIETLKTQNSDDKDFHEVSVWNLATALQQAYNLGQNHSKNRKGA